MHDPMVVAFEIRRPWPRRSSGSGRRYWPSLVTVWHVEPGGRDSGDVCPHYRTIRRPDGKKRTVVLHGWRWHVHHWRIQIHPLQALRRRALTRCTWCGGRSQRTDLVNTSHGSGRRASWWRGEQGLYHSDCSSIATAHAVCICHHPVLIDGGYGRCARCNKTRAFGVTAGQLERTRILAEVPKGARDAERYAQVLAMVDAERPRKNVAQ
jgi:hypothetical protein